MSVEGNLVPSVTRLPPVLRKAAVFLIPQPLPFGSLLSSFGLLNNLGGYVEGSRASWAPSCLSHIQLDLGAALKRGNRGLL